MLKNSRYLSLYKCSMKKGGTLIYNSISIEVKKNHPLYPYFQKICNAYKRMYNATNFYIRNTMTGIKKSPEERFANETGVLHFVHTCLQKWNKGSQNYPLPEKWFLNYNKLDAIFKLSNNADYRSLPIQTSQQAIKDCTEAWSSFFKIRKDYKQHPAKYKGKPRIPKYKKTDMATATFTNMNCKIKEYDFTTSYGREIHTSQLSFPKTKDKLLLGGYSFEGKRLKEVKVKPYYGRFKVFLILESLGDMESPEVQPKRCYGIDLGVENFAAIANNIGVRPMVVKGGFLKARNQYYNKMKAKLKSILDRSGSGQQTSKRLNRMYRKRKNFLHDAFYKISHFIIREAVKDQIDTIFIGKNDGWKNEINLGRKNNQEFTSLPHAKFIQILTVVANKYQIQVIRVEESYTSKASLLDLDDLPVYKEGDTQNYTFTGKRTRRGLYRSNDGTFLNADINGAGNVIRKGLSDAFDLLDLNFLVENPRIVSFKDLYKTG